MMKIFVILSKTSGVAISNRGNHFQISGGSSSVRMHGKVLNELYEQTTGEDYLTPAQVHLFCAMVNIRWYIRRLRIHKCLKV